MTKENAIKRLEDSEQELSYSQRLAIADILRGAKEICEEIVRQSKKSDYYCCDRIAFEGFHDKDCINGKAQDWLNKESEENVGVV